MPSLRRSPSRERGTRLGCARGTYSLVFKGWSTTGLFVGSGQPRLPLLQEHYIRLGKFAYPKCCRVAQTRRRSRVFAKALGPELSPLMAAEFHRREIREAAALPEEAWVPCLLFCAGQVRGKLCSSELSSVPDSIIFRSESATREGHRRRVWCGYLGSIIAKKAFRCQSRRSSLAEKPWLLVAFGVALLGHRLHFLVPLLLEPAVNESTHQGARRDTAPEAMAAQAQVCLLLEPHGHGFVEQGSHRRPSAYTSPPLLAPPSRRASAEPGGTARPPTLGRTTPPLSLAPRRND